MHLKPFHTPDPETRQRREVAAILHYADTLEKRITKGQRRKIVDLLKEVVNTQADVTKQFMQKYGLPEAMRSSVAHVVYRICQQNLHHATRKRRRRLANLNNRAIGRERIIDHAACGKLGGQVRAAQFARKGHPAGHKMWRGEEIARLTSLLSKPAQLSREAARAGEPFTTYLYNQFRKHFPRSRRTFSAVRAWARRFLQRKDAPNA